jgi:hypothetical protein
MQTLNLFISQNSLAFTISQILIAGPWSEVPSLYFQVAGIWSLTSSLWFLVLAGHWKLNSAKRNLTNPLTG